MAFVQKLWHVFCLSIMRSCNLFYLKMASSLANLGNMPIKLGFSIDFRCRVESTGLVTLTYDLSALQDLSKYFAKLEDCMATRFSDLSYAAFLYLSIM